MTQTNNLSNKWKLSISALVIGSLLAGCGDGREAKRLADEGQAALKECDLTRANDRFGGAYDLRSDDGELAVAYALTGMIILLEDPAVQELLPRFGFTTSPVEFDWVWEEDGWLSQRAGNAPCSVLENMAMENLPHPALFGPYSDPAVWSGPEPEYDNYNSSDDYYEARDQWRESFLYFGDTIDPTLTFEDIGQVLLALSPRLIELSDAFEDAAKSAGQNGYNFEGGCGIDETNFQAPELYTMAATLRLLVSASYLVGAYDLDIPFVTFIEDDLNETFINSMNEHFLIVDDPAQGLAALTHFTRTVNLLDLAVDEIVQLEGVPRVENSLFDWSHMPVRVTDDISTIVDALKVAVEGDLVLPQLSPEITFSFASIFSDPIGRNSSEIMFELVEDEYEDDYYDIETDWTPIVDELNERTSPDLLEFRADYYCYYDYDYYSSEESCLESCEDECVQEDEFFRFTLDFAWATEDLWYEFTDWQDDDNSPYLHVLDPDRLWRDGYLFCR